MRPRTLTARLGLALFAVSSLTACNLVLTRKPVEVDPYPALTRAAAAETPVTCDLSCDTHAEFSMTGLTPEEARASAEAHDVACHDGEPGHTQVVCEPAE